MAKCLKKLKKMQDLENYGLNLMAGKWKTKSFACIFIFSIQPHDFVC